ncbi:uncharacterized protein SPSK_03119 [Sporothrix schenckii 1099-18]|uniref:Uncharacterized protein n=1 Tax=Sporothrix schenckii 1099-18 TaxID=1397361 RepID=A0A0F2LXE3_SPOSC|nr:uncharacterized protein SPSK_03119 [Sporothrix schenckii 1099-18]KJR82133.1 hypothetical protein SPSK_03119 [Sporothrix schenckii 1099-18]
MAGPPTPPLTPPPIATGVLPALPPPPPTLLSGLGGARARNRAMISCRPSMSLIMAAWWCAVDASPLRAVLLGRQQRVDEHGAALGHGVAAPVPQPVRGPRQRLPVRVRRVVGVVGAVEQLEAQHDGRRHAKRRVRPDGQRLLGQRLLVLAQNGRGRGHAGRARVPERGPALERVVEHRPVDHDDLLGGRDGERAPGQRQPGRLRCGGGRVVPQQKLGDLRHVGPHHAVARQDVLVRLGGRLARAHRPQPVQQRRDQRRRPAQHAHVRRVGGLAGRPRHHVLVVAVVRQRCDVLRRVDDVRVRVRDLEVVLDHQLQPHALARLDLDPLVPRVHLGALVWRVGNRVRNLVQAQAVGDAHRGTHQNRIQVRAVEVVRDPRRDDNRLHRVQRQVLQKVLAVQGVHHGLELPAHQRLVKVPVARHLAPVRLVVEQRPQRHAAHGKVQRQPQRVVRRARAPKLLALRHKRRPVERVVVPPQVVHVERHHLTRNARRQQHRRLRRVAVAGVRPQRHGLPADPRGVAVDRCQLRIPPVLVAAAAAVREACLAVPAPGQKLEAGQDGRMVVVELVRGRHALVLVLLLVLVLHGSWLHADDRRRRRCGHACRTGHSRRSAVAAAHFVFIRRCRAVHRRVHAHGGAVHVVGIWLGWPIVGRGRLAVLQEVDASVNVGDGIVAAGPQRDQTGPECPQEPQLVPVQRQRLADPHHLAGACFGQPNASATRRLLVTPDLALRAFYQVSWLSASPVV